MTNDEWIYDYVEALEKRVTVEEMDAAVHEANATYRARRDRSIWRRWLGLVRS